MYLRSSSKFTFNPDRPPMSFDHVLHDFRAESRSAWLGANGVFGEEPISHVRQHPITRIDDRNHDRGFRRRGLSAHGHGAACGHFGDRVVEQIKEGSIEASLVCHDQRE